MVTYNGEKSTFNEGAGQMDRINRLQDEINMLWRTPLDKLFGRYCYLLIFDDTNSLLGEVSSKLTDTEYKEALIEKDQMTKLLSIPIIKKVHWVSLGNPDGKKEIVNYKLKEKIFSSLYQYGLYVRKLLEEHNMTSPKEQDPSKAIFGH